MFPEEWERVFLREAKMRREQLVVKVCEGPEILL